MASHRSRASSGSPFETEIGFSRAVRIGSRILVSGTAPISKDGTTAAVGDAFGQATRCLEIIVGAIEQLGGSREGVVRTRTYLTRAVDWRAVGEAHGRYFGEVQPASTMVVVAALLEPDWLVEIEAEAIVDDEP